MKRTIFVVAILLSGLILTSDVGGQRRKTQRQTQAKPATAKVPKGAPLAPESNKALERARKLLKSDELRGRMVGGVMLIAFAALLPSELRSLTGGLRTESARRSSKNELEQLKSAIAAIDETSDKYGDDVRSIVDLDSAGTISGVQAAAIAAHRACIEKGVAALAALENPCTARSPTQATGRTHTVNLNGGVKLEMVEIPTGSFCMGSTNGYADEKPVHQVRISQAFYMGKYEVTQAQWQAVMGNNPSEFKDCGGNCPVEHVSWDDAIAFIARLNAQNDGFAYRLPTEAEWEYACRAGTSGDYAGNLSEMAWYWENSGFKTHAVGRKQPNAWGLADMHGNVWEWCQDGYHKTYYGAPTDGSVWLSGGEQEYRVVRGGSLSDVNSFLRSAARNLDTRDHRDHEHGFRLVSVVRTQ